MDFDPTKQIAILWHVEDVKSIRPDLDDEQALGVLQIIKRHHDATIGVNWDVIESVVDYMYPKKEGQE